MPHPEDRIITFENFSDPFLAEVIKGKFEANDIPGFLKGGVNPLGTPGMDGIQLMIFEKDLEKARRIRDEPME